MSEKLQQSIARQVNRVRRRLWLKTLMCSTLAAQSAAFLALGLAFVAIVREHGAERRREEHPQQPQAHQNSRHDPGHPGEHLERRSALDLAAAQESDRMLQEIRAFPFRAELRDIGKGHDFIHLRLSLL